MAELRTRTREAHARVDRKFSVFDLGNRDDYCRFLLAHARALPVVEAILAAESSLPPIRPRTPLLAGDIACLQQRFPEPLPFAGTSTAAGFWGVLYVVEGSRMGGDVLSRRVPAELPTRYLRAKHESGEWSALGKAIDAQADANIAAWLDEAVLGANACFDLYEQACRTRVTGG